MAFFKRKTSTVGLDIGSGFVKMVQVDHAGEQPEVSRVAMRPLLPDAIVEGEIMDHSLVADTVSGLFEEIGMKGQDVVTAVGGHDVIIKKIEMDRMKESDARDVIRWEAEQHVPFDIKSVELDFQILDPEGEGMQMEVLLVAAKRELVDNKVSLLTDAGMNPGVIDVDAFALHNAFEHNYPEAMDGIVALANVGHEVTNVTVVLPRGGLVMDAVIDTLRRNLYLSNIELSQVEVFRLQDEQFLAPVGVGARPLGLSLNRWRDTLLVGNSAGTNISNVFLGDPSGFGPFREDDPRRLLTPDVVLFDVQRLVDNLGILRYRVFFNSDANPPGFTDRPQFLAVDSTGRVLYSTVTTELGDFGTIRQAFIPPDLGRPNEVRPEVKLFFEHAALTTAPDFVAVGNVDRIVVVTGDLADNVIMYDHVPGFPDDTITAGPALIADAIDQLAMAGSDVVSGTGRFSVPNLGFSDTTFVTASGDGGWVLFGEGAVDPVGRLIMYEAGRDRISRVVEVADIMDNASETVKGIGLNYDGTLGVARGIDAYFFTTDLRLQGKTTIPGGGAGAVLHPLHANALNFDGGEYRPDTHLAFVGTGERTIDVIDTQRFRPLGRLFIRDIIQGPLRAVLPFPEDNVGLQCVSVPVTDQVGATIGGAVQIYENGDFETPYAPDGATEDSCIVVKLFGVTNTGGVVVVDVRKADILREHPSR